MSHIDTHTKVNTEIKHLINDMTSAVCRATRALLGITQRQLAEQAALSTQTVADFERGARTPHPNNLRAIREVFEGYGIKFASREGAIYAIEFSSVQVDDQ